jgi:hypothetical protein
MNDQSYYNNDDQTKKYVARHPSLITHDYNRLLDVNRYDPLQRTIYKGCRMDIVPLENEKLLTDGCANLVINHVIKTLRIAHVLVYPYMQPRMTDVFICTLYA